MRRGKKLVYSRKAEWEESFAVLHSGKSYFLLHKCILIYPLITL